MFQGLFLVIFKIAELSWTLLIKECKKPIKSYQSLLWYRASDKQDAYFDKRRALSCNSQIQNTSQLFFIRKYENKINMKWSASCVTKVSPPMFLRIFSITILSQHVGWDTGQIRHREPHWATIFGQCQPSPPGGPRCTTQHTWDVLISCPACHCDGIIEILFYYQALWAELSRDN